MADEKDLSNQIANGIWGTAKAVGGGIADAASNLGSQAVDLYNMSPEDQLKAVATGNGKDIMQQKQNFQDVQSTLNAQNPTPNPNTFMIDENNPVAQLNASTAALQNNGQPLNPNDALLASKGVAPVPDQLKGTAAAVNDLQATPAQPQGVPGAPQLPAAIDPFAGSNAMAIRGIQSAAKAGAESAAAEHAYFQKKADLEIEAADKQQKLQEAFDFKFQEKMDGYEQSVKDFKALAGEKIVPGAFLARQDTAGSLMTGLAVALGGIGGALQGTNKNIGLEMIDKAIDRDVAAQQYNLEFKSKIGAQDLQNQSSLLSKMREKFGDDKSAIIATKLAMTEMVQSKMNSELTKKGGARDLAVQGQAQTAMAQVLQRKEMLSMQLKAAQAAQFEQSQMTQALKGSRKNWGDMEITAYEKLTGDKSVRDRFVPGWGTASNKNLAEEFTKANTELTGALDGINRIKQLTNGFNKVTDLATRRKIEAERQALVGNLRLPFTGPGILNDSERAMLEKIIGDPSRILSLNKLEAASMAQVETKLRADQAKRAKMSGLEEQNNVDSLGTSVP